MDELLKDLNSLLESWKYHADTLAGDDHPMNGVEAEAYYCAIQDVKDVIEQRKKETT